MAEETRSFWAELKHRKVVRVALLYVVVGWGVVEVSTTLESILGLPDWTPKLVLVIVLLGLPLALVLAWAFEVTPDGVQRAEKPAAAGGAYPSRWPFIAGLGVGIASVTAVAFAVSGGRGGETGPLALDESLVAVLPFEFSGPDDLQYLGEGLVHLIAPRFDGVVGPRAVDPASSTAVARDFASRDAESLARAVSGIVGSGLTVSGSAVAVGQGLALNATLRNVTDGSVIATAQADGPVDSITAVVDRLAAGLLARNAGEYEQSLGMLTSTSPEALREYLLGQQSSREADFQRAVDHFRRAIEMDSTFALAAINLADAGNNATDTDNRGALELAWRHRDRLDERDRVYLEARLIGYRPEGATNEDRVRAYEAVLRLQPDRPFLWYFVGDYSFHVGWNRGEGWLERTRGYFVEALRRDPRHGAAMMHLLFADIVSGDVDAIRESSARLAEFSDSSHTPLWAGVVNKLVNADSAGFGTSYDRLIDVANGGYSDLVVFPWVADAGWKVQAAERAGRARLERGAASGVSSLNRHRWLYQLLMVLGRPAEAEAVIERHEAATGDYLYEMRLMDAAWGALPADRGAEALQVHRDTLARVPAALRSGTQWRHVMRAGIWHLSRGDTTALKGSLDELSGGETPTRYLDSLQIATVVELLEADLALRRGRRERASERMGAVSRLLDTGVAHGPSLNAGILFASADILKRLDRRVEALQALQRQWYFSINNPQQAEFLRERARLSAAVGDTAAAIQGYEHYLRLRHAPEPSLADDVAEVRAALSALRP